MQLDSPFTSVQSELRMRAAKAAIFCSLTVLGALGQAPPPVQDPSPQDASRLQREKQIRQYDPLDKSNPLGDDPDGQRKGTRKDPVRTDPASRPMRGSVAESNQSGGAASRQ